MDDAQLEDPSGLTYGLLDYALRHPDDPRWREQLLLDLTRDNDHCVLHHHLGQLTIYPGHGAFAVPAVLRLIAHPDRWVRGCAAEVLMILAHDFPASVTPADWVEAVLPLLDDEDAITREYAGNVLKHAGWVAPKTGKPVHPQKRPRQRKPKR